MAKISGADAIKKALKQYGGSDFNYFQLKDDNDSAQIRFLHAGDDDLDIMVVHQVEIEIDGQTKKRYVECLQEEGCPLCAKGKPQLKVFLFLIKSNGRGILDLDDIFLWERGPGIVNDLLGFIQKYGSLNNRNYEVVRHGKKGDTKTSYQFFPEDKVEGEDITLPNRPAIIGRVVLQWDKDEMAAYVAENTAVERGRGRNAQGGTSTF